MNADGAGQRDNVDGQQGVRGREACLPTLILKARLNPLAKNPPNGPMSEAKVERAMLWIWKGYILTVF